MRANHEPIRHHVLGSRKAESAGNLLMSELGDSSDQL